jgi:hypothetical protein
MRVPRFVCSQVCVRRDAATHNKRMQRTRVMDKVVLRLGHWRVADARRCMPRRRRTPLEKKAVRYSRDRMWSKVPDAPLRAVVAEKLQRRKSNRPGNRK